MSETAKTLAFMAAGAVALLAAFAVVPGQNTFDTEELVGQRLNQFEPDAAKRLKIIKFDAETATPREFEVAEENGLWTIPSKQGYPADATKQMAKAATCLVDREILRIASTSRSDHAALGVVDPSSAKLNSQADGVGTRVTMSDNNNKLLTDMIVGKAVKDAEGQHYVRNTEQDIVYVVKIDPKDLTTRFEDWIEDDLLKISSFDIRRADIKDYTAELMLTLQGYQARWEPRAEMELIYSDTDSKWSAESLKKFNTAEKKYVDFEIPEGEELNQDALNKMRDGLDDLTIVDVERKPAGLSSDLKAGEDFLKDDAAAENLMMRGFAPIGSANDKQTDILSSEGEVVCSLKDGVEYVLRFGNLQMETADGASKPADEDTEESEEKKPGESVNRYLFVMARFNESMIEKPELDELPEIPADVEEAAEEASEEADAGETASETDADSPESDEVAEAAPEEEQEKPQVDESPEEGETEAEPAEEDSESTSASETEEAPAEEDADTGKAASAAGEEKSADDEAKAKELADIMAARTEIEVENQRRMEEYQEKIKKGKEQVAELNERFGDWYYVISNDVFQQVHLGLDKVVKEKEADKDDKDAEAQAPAGGIPGMPNLPFGAPPASE